MNEDQVLESLKKSRLIKTADCLQTRLQYL